MSEDLPLPRSHESHEHFMMLQSLCEQWKEGQEFLLEPTQRAAFEAYIAMILADPAGRGSESFVFDHAKIVHAALALPGEGYIEPEQRMAKTLSMHDGTKRAGPIAAHLLEHGFEYCPDHDLCTIILRGDIVRVLNMYISSTIRMNEFDQRFLRAVKMLEFSKSVHLHPLWTVATKQNEWLRREQKGEAVDPREYPSIPPPVLIWEEREAERNRDYSDEFFESIRDDVERRIQEYLGGLERGSEGNDE